MGLKRKAVSAINYTEAAGLDVRAFTPNGAPLTPANFEVAINAALEEAHLRCDAPQNNDANKGGCAVLIPPGNWALQEGLFIQGQYPKTSPSLVGMGPAGTVVLRFHPNATFPGIGIGIDPETGLIQPGGTYALGVTLQNLDIYMQGGASAKGGIRARNTLFCTLKDLMIRGAGQGLGPNDEWHEAVGVDFRNNNVGEAFIEGQNHQHLYMNRVSANYSFIGFWFGEAVWSGTVIEGHPNGCTYGAVYETGCTIGWFGGNCQGDGHIGAKHSSGMMYTTGLPSGAAASVSEAVNGFSTVTGLTNMLGWRGAGSHVTYKNSFLVLGKRIYRIVDVLSASSCVIRRTTGGAALTNQAWHVRGSGGGQEVQLNGQIYHEGTDHYYLELGKDFQSGSIWNLQSCQTKIQRAIVSAVAVNAITVKNCKGAGALTAILDQVIRFETDADISTIDTDDWSRNGIIARQKTNFPLSGRVWDSRPRSTRYNAALLEREAIIFDARKRSSIVRTGGNVTSWTDLAGTSTLTQITPGSAPHWLDMDVELGAPAVQLFGNPNTGLQCNLGPRFAPGHRSPTLIVIGRTSEAVQAGTRRVSLDSTGLIQAYIGFDDQQHSNSRDLYAYYWMPGFGFVAPNLVASDAKGHWLFSAAIVAGTESGGGGSESLYRVGSSAHGDVRWGVPFPNDLILSLFPPLGPTVGDLIISHVAIIPRGITDQEREHWRDLALNEFNIESGGY